MAVPHGSKLHLWKCIQHMSARWKCAVQRRHISGQECKAPDAHRKYSANSSASKRNPSEIFVTTVGVRNEAGQCRDTHLLLYFAQLALLLLRKIHLAHNVLDKVKLPLVQKTRTEGSPCLHLLFYSFYD